MISMRNTENLAGVIISGDYNDFYELVDAFHEVTIDEYSERHRSYYDVSIRLLGICYDIRHAYMGDREIAFVDNHMSEHKMAWHGVIAPQQNLHYECNILYTEMIFSMLVINELIDIRMQELVKSKHLLYKAYTDKKVIWDRTIIVLRGFQSAFAKCVQDTITPNSYSRWLKTITEPYINISSIATQYLDLITIKWIDWTKEKRLKTLTSITRRIADFWNDHEHNEIKKEVALAAREYNCSESEIRMRGYDYPDEIEW